MFVSDKECRVSMQAMLDLTVNRMLLNPDTVAKISDLVNKHENVQLELIFKLGLDGSSKHPGKFHLNLFSCLELSCYKKWQKKVPSKKILGNFLQNWFKYL